MPEDTSRRSEEIVEFLLLDVGGLRLALPVTAVRGIHRMVEVSRLPHAPAVIEGMINVHGTTVAVVDLRRRMGRPSGRARLTDHLVEVHAAGRRLALHVERAVEVLAVPVARIDMAPPPEIDYAAGLVKLDDGLLVIHDLAAFLTVEEGLQLDEALVTS